MTGIEAGWYRDPAPPNPAFPTTLRYWDGSGWTTEVRAASRREREAWHREMAHAQAVRAGQAWEQAVAAGTATPGALADAAQRFATPDGQPLSGWWRRVFALLIDGVVIGAVGMLLAWPWVSRVGTAYDAFLQQVTDNASAGRPMPDPTSLYGEVLGPLLVVLTITWAVQLVYGVGFLKAFAATPGKMLLGLQVRLRERPGPLPWGTVLARWFTQNAGALFGIVPLIGMLGSVFTLLDVLWPTWDGRRQALHDKAARTHVVRTR